jgi:hypothetical protein
MHKALEDIPDRILTNALGALTHANTLAVYRDPGKEHHDDLCVLSAALAGELTLKAIIAEEHPLLLFKDLFHLDQPGNDEFDIEHTIRSGKTYGLEHLPQLLWVARNDRLPDKASFDAVRSARNSVQHFCTPSGVDLREVSLRFIYNNIDPLIKKYFDFNAIEFHEDHAVSYDYVVSSLIGHELAFSIPDDFAVTEIDIEAELREASQVYREGFGRILMEAANRG